MKDTTFENYLQEKHSEQYVGLDDDMPDDFNDWLCALDPQEIIDYAEVWGLMRERDGLKLGKEVLDKHLTKTP